MGCATSRFSVLDCRSLLIASKPSARPTIGPNSAIKYIKDGIELPLDV